MNITQLIVLAGIGEALWETLKMVWQNGKISIDRVGAMVIGLFLAIATGMDIMKLIDIPVRIPFAGVILTGLLISRGANFMHDILASINNVHINTKQS